MIRKVCQIIMYPEPRRIVMKCGASHAPAQKSTPKKPKMNMGGYMSIKKKKMPGQMAYGGMAHKKKKK